MGEGETEQWEREWQILGAPSAKHAQRGPFPAGHGTRQWESYVASDVEALSLAFPRKGILVAPSRLEFGDEIDDVQHFGGRDRAD
jgi:hypothetical protein